MITAIGCIRYGDEFTYCGRRYKCGHLIKGTNGYVACIDIETKKVKRLYIDTSIEVD